MKLVDATIGYTTFHTLTIKNLSKITFQSIIRDVSITSLVTTQKMLQVSHANWRVPYSVFSLVYHMSDIRTNRDIISSFRQNTGKVSESGSFTRPFNPAW